MREVKKAICVNRPKFSKIHKGGAASPASGSMSGMNGLKGKRHRFQGLTAFVFSLCLLAFPGYAAPPVPATSPCDPTYYESLKSRAWLEAQREVTTNEIAIFKPDSVLQYTCFDRFLNELAANSPSMFTGTTRWGSGMAGDMTKALQDLVGTALKSYLTSNFSPAMRGGRSTNVSYAPGQISPGTYSCDIMGRVWQEAKCLGTENMFYTFEQLATSPDFRFQYAKCNPTPEWRTNIDRATVDAKTPWTEDNVVTYLDMLDPAKCKDLKPIETGIVVNRSKEKPYTYPERVCIPAGCYYNAESEKCERP
jgi:hypothetical protein